HRPAARVAGRHWHDACAHHPRRKYRCALQSLRQNERRRNCRNPASGPSSSIAGLGCAPMNIVGFAFRNLQRRLVRTSLSIVSIGLAVGSALALIAISRSIEEGTRDGMDEIGDDVIVTQRGASDLFG